MALTVVVGGQYGSEGKGKLVAHLASVAKVHVSVVRCGGPNSGHTVDLDGTPYPLRQLPSGVRSDCFLYLSAGMIIDPTLFEKEMIDWGVERSRIRIDANAVIVDDRDLEFEESSNLRKRVGSTLSGTGSAVARKALRDPTQLRASDVPAFFGLVDNVSMLLNDQLDRGGMVIVEGTQGTGLSLHHSQYFPFVTSRDTTAAGFLSEVGLSPVLVSDVYLIFRTFPIRVAGNSGPMNGEMTWEALTASCGSPAPLTEQTTVTRMTRRLGMFDWDQAEEAVRLNRPTKLAVHGLDYLDFCNRHAKTWDELSLKAKAFVKKMERRLNAPVEVLFTGPRTCDVIDLNPSRLQRGAKSDLVELLA